jgi:anthranilate synthase component 1
MDLMLFENLIVFDNLRQKIILIANVHTDGLDESFDKAVKKLDEMEELILNGEAKKIEPGRLLEEIKPVFSKEEYCEKVRKVKQHIIDGDIFQLVLSNPMEARFEGSLFDTYRILRTTNPSPYMFYFSGDTEIAGASPETLVKVEDRVIRTFPLAGTRPRGATYEEDQALEKELLADEKEKAEHNMLVDLGRNDLGKLCDFGTVEVEKYMEIERYSHVMHIGSSVKGHLSDEHDAIDAVDSVLPAGTLSGAPKIRACQIIDELEDNKRGIYGGAIGYVDFTGNLDTCIAIRLAYKKNGKVFVRSGAGLVADSVPENEFIESVNKAKAVVNAIKESTMMTQN